MLEVFVTCFALHNLEADGYCWGTALALTLLGGCVTHE
jgi:hypothetical protein